MAGQFDPFAKENPNQNRFIELYWGRFIADARATLAQMLARPIDEAQKTLIHEALVLDNPLHTHRTRNTELM